MSFSIIMIEYFVLRWFTLYMIKMKVGSRIHIVVVKGERFGDL